MRYAKALLFLALLTSGCRNEIEIRDVNFLIHNQLENNVREISALQEELKDLKIDDVKHNRKLVRELLQTHKDLQAAYDSMDHMRHYDASLVAGGFIKRHFRKIIDNDEVDPVIKVGTPPVLTKFYMATLEARYVIDAKSRYRFHDENFIKLLQFKLLIIPSAPVFKEGEPITGELKIVAESSFSDVKKAIKKMTLNGMEIKPGTDGWKFSLTPKIGGKGLVPYELAGKGLWGDTTSYKGQTVVYVQKR